MLKKDPYIFQPKFSTESDVACMFSKRVFSAGKLLNLLAYRVSIRLLTHSNTNSCAGIYYLLLSALPIKEKQLMSEITWCTLAGEKSCTFFFFFF